MEHRGIRVELTGTIEGPIELGGSKTFLSLQETVCGPGSLPANSIFRYPFDFSIPSTALESFEGSLLRIRYRVTAKLLKRGFSAIMSDAHRCTRMLWVERTAPIDRHLFTSQSQQCLVGTEDGHLQVAVTLDSPDAIFRTSESVKGVVNILGPQRLPLVSVELQIVRRESINGISESNAISRYQLIDGIPFSDDNVRFDLPIPSNIPQISSTMPPSPSRTFSVEYSLAIVLIEEGGSKSYFKQLPIHLIRTELSETMTNSKCLKGLNEPYSLNM